MNTTCGSYDSTDNIFDVNGSLISTNITNLTSNFYQLDNNTYFIINNKITNLLNTGFIQKNEWEFLPNIGKVLLPGYYTYDNISNQFIIIFPSDFILLLSSNVYYSISNISVTKMIL